MQPASAPDLPGLTVKRSLFTLNEGMFTANAPLGVSGVSAWPGAVDFAPVESSAFAQPGAYRGRGRNGRNGAAQAAIILGAVASIAGAAVLVYANRPECGTNQMASGCGYGTKVVGGAVLSAGLVGILIGALTWR